MSRHLKSKTLFEMSDSINTNSATVTGPPTIEADISGTSMTTAKPQGHNQIGDQGVGHRGAPAHPDCGAFLTDDRCLWRVWAPTAREVHLVLNHDQGRSGYRMDREGECFTFELSPIVEGQRYTFMLDSGTERPDPASRWQPEGVHAASAVWDPNSFEWSDQAWEGIPRASLVFYELHVGTFTREGTFDAIHARLEALRDLGVTAIELMPIAQFPGRKNWGYDGTYWYAVQNSYGGPRQLQCLVDACHRLGLSVFLDVVYNHVGPEGNYLAEFGPYFTDLHHTPWGKAINYDDRGSDGVRGFVLNNVRQWVRDFHIDGLRLDSVHAIQDCSHHHILAEIKAVANEEAARLRKHVHIVAESSLNDARRVFRQDGMGFSLDAQWNDDFHHCVHALLTHEEDGYYQDFQQPLPQLEKVLNRVFAFDGNFSEFRGKNHGVPAGTFSGDRFVIAVQNHDQVGNRPHGERLSQLIGANELRFAAALMLVSPYLPLIFMGEEYGESNPFPFFCDFGDPDLCKAVSDGRRREFAHLDWTTGFPDPCSESTFASAILTWDWSHAKKDGLRKLYQDLLIARRDWPQLHDFQHREAQIVTAGHGESVLRIVRTNSVCPNEQIEAYFNPGNATVILRGMSRPKDQILLSTEDLKYGGWKRSVNLSWDLSPFECIIVKRNQGAST